MVNNKKKIDKPDDYIEAYFADTHGGNALSLLNPKTLIPVYDERGDIIDENSVHMNAANNMLWDLYDKHTDQVCKFANGLPIFINHVGDATQGSKYPAAFVDDTPAGQAMIAYKNIGFFVEKAQTSVLKLFSGTQSHTFFKNTAIRILKNFFQLGMPNLNIRTLHHGVQMINEKDGIDVAHHGGFPSSREWLKGNPVRFYLRDIVLSNMKEGIVPPRWVIRGHYHEPIWETLRVLVGDSFQEFHAANLPSYSLMGEWTRQATRSKAHVYLGMMALKIQSGEVTDVGWFMKRKDIRTVIEL